MFPYDQGNNSFSNDNDLNKHIIAHHILLTKIEAFKCDKCNVICETNFELQNNIMTAHLLIKDQEKSIENKNTLRKKIPCNQCEKTFVNSGDLDNHIKTSHFKNDHESNEANILHINAKMFPCDQCQVKFSNPDNLNNHKRTHHLKNQDTVYFNEAFTENKSQEIPILFCDLCNYRTRSNTTLKRHYELNHNCDKCDKTFTSNR